MLFNYLKENLNLFKRTNKEEIFEIPWNEMQVFFVEWTSKRLGISKDEAKARYEASWATFEGGHKGAEFRDFNIKSYSLYGVFVGDRAEEVYDSYKVHGNMHFLRMLSYGDSYLHPEHEVISALSQKKTVRILDFGCGLAKNAIKAAEILSSMNVSVELFLCDISTLRKDFLISFCKEKHIKMEFLDCTQENPFPIAESLDLIIATEVFEHIHDPLSLLKKFHCAMNIDSYLLTNIADHKEEFMHVSPNLESLRKKLFDLSYFESKKYYRYKKVVDKEF